VQSGFENGVATPAMSPVELAPTGQWQLQWPKWGQFYETKGVLGETPDIGPAKELLGLFREWVDATDLGQREAVWHKMLKIHAENTYTIGVISGVYQPVVSNKALRNVPEEGVYNFEPGAFFGMYRPDTFWFEK
jgi:peptide/nickel transport system substrate-binding protein